MMAARRAPGSLTGPIGASAVLHAAIILPLLLFHASSGVQMPPMYKVELLAAPPGERAVGVVTSAPAPEVATIAPPKAVTKETKTVKTAAKTKKAVKPVVQATPKMAPKSAVPWAARAPTCRRSTFRASIFRTPDIFRISSARSR
jgi:hypothetical protein